MLKFIIFLALGWFLLKIFKGAKFLRKNNVTTPKKDSKNKLKYNKGDIEDAEFKDLD